MGFRRSTGAAIMDIPTVCHNRGVVFALLLPENDAQSLATLRKQADESPGLPTRHSNRSLGTNIMSAEENKQVARRFYEDVVNTGNIDLLDEILSPGYFEVHQNKRYPIGIEGAKQHILGGRETYPDLHLTIERQVAEGDWVVTQAIARGTHQGVWLGMRPTGRKVEMTIMNIDRIVNGLIVEHGGAADLLFPFLEIGAVKIADPVED